MNVQVKTSTGYIVLSDGEGYRKAISLDEAQALFAQLAAVEGVLPRVRELIPFDETEDKDWTTARRLGAMHPSDITPMFASKCCGNSFEEGAKFIIDKIKGGKK